MKLRFFAGLSTPEAAKALGISVASAERWWAFARTWLFSELQEDDSSRNSCHSMRGFDSVFPH